MRKKDFNLLPWLYNMVVANLVMEVLEVRVLETFIDPPRIYKRYVDDTICVIRREYIDMFHQHLNSQDNHIKFTVERYSSAGIPFLDTLNKILEDGSIEVSVYRKKTHTDRYLQFSSHHPSQHKAAVVRTLYHRAENLLSLEKNVHNERTYIQSALMDNGYPRQFIKKFNKQSSKKEQISGEETKGYVTLPYVQGVTEKIQRVLQSYNIKVSIRPASTLRKILSSKIKDPRQTKRRLEWYILFHVVNAILNTLGRRKDLWGPELRNIRQVFVYRRLKDQRYVNTH